MRKFRNVVLIMLVCISLTGCLALSKMLQIGTEGFTSPEGQQAGIGASMIAEPIVGEGSLLTPIIAGIASLVAGGFAVWKRQKWLDTPTS